MHAWVRFLNKTKYSAVYIKINDIALPLLAVHGRFSDYITAPAGSVVFELFDNHGHFCREILLSLPPGRLYSVILK